MALDLFICTNAVNYAVAKALLAKRPRPAILLYESRRFAVQTLPGVRQWRLSVTALRWLRLRYGWLPFGTVHVPHHKLSARLAPILAKARHVEFLDDGLDTLRTSPRNMDLAALKPGDVYNTFAEYPRLPPWLDALDVRRVASLRDLLGGSLQPTMDLAPYDHVFVESPGLDPQSLSMALGLDNTRVLVVRHPIEFKRGPLPAGCASVVGNQVDCEGSLVAARGKNVYFGETMAFFIAWHGGAANHNRLWLQMAEAQWQGLCGLPAMKAVDLPGVAGRVAAVEA